MEIKELIKLSYENAKNKGFWDKKRNVGEMLMLIVTELGEALEAHRNNKFANYEEYIKYPEGLNYYQYLIKNTFEEEIADVFIRLADLCGGLNIDIEKFIELKMTYNKTRKKLHGKKY
jgi:NTP pyrophosphatase (non-canonical NTP hydrolase)